MPIDIDTDEMIYKTRRLRELMLVLQHSDPVPWRFEPCTCGHPSCTGYFVNFTRSDGRLDKIQAEFICLARELLPELLGDMS